MFQVLVFESCFTPSTDTALILSGFVHLTFRMAPFFSQCCFRAQVTRHSLWQGDFPRDRKQVVKQAQVPPGSLHTIVSPLE